MIPILLVHGSFHTGECWDTLTPHLKARGFDGSALILSGRRGSGVSSMSWPI
jgi:hypothetical protein